MNVAVRDAPGVSSPFNWITDISGPVDPNSLVETYQLYSSFNPVFYFTLSNTYYTKNTVEQNAATAMSFTQMGIMGGPLKHANGTPNVGGVVTIQFAQGIVGGNYNPTPIITTTIDLTSWVPGQFYWSNPLPKSFDFWGKTYTAPGVVGTEYFYIIYLSCPVPYTLYTDRFCTLRNGSQWGSGPSDNYHQYPFNDHVCPGGAVDFTYANYVDLGTASLTPDIAVSGNLQHTGVVDAGAFSPKIQLAGRPRSVGVFDPANLAIKPVLYATSMAGGPLWKPAKLCTG